MSNKVQYVDFTLTRTLDEYSNPEFYSEHSEDDIRDWLKDKEDEYPEFLEDLGEEVGWDHDSPDDVNVRNLSISEQVLDSEPYCEYDDEIQDWIDGKPEREKRLLNIQRNHKFRTLYKGYLSITNDIRKSFQDDEGGREWLQDHTTEQFQTICKNYGLEESKLSDFMKLVDEIDDL